MLKILVAFLSAVVAINAGIIPIPTVKVLQGPSSKTSLHGPDGSLLNSVAPGGTVGVDGSANLVPVGPTALPHGPDHVLTGPAGSIVTSHTGAGPAIVAAVPVAVASPVAGLGAVGLIGDVDDHAGDYIPDGSEGLYDDGSYPGDYH